MIRYDLLVCPNWDMTISDPPILNTDWRDTIISSFISPMTPILYFTMLLLGDCNHTVIKFAICSLIVIVVRPLCIMLKPMFSETED